MRIITKNCQTKPSQTKHESTNPLANAATASQTGPWDVCANQTIPSLPAYVSSHSDWSVMAEHGVHTWDVAAIKPLVEEAGGRFSDWDNTPTIHRPDVVASNGRLHDAVLRILNGT